MTTTSTVPAPGQNPGIVPPWLTGPQPSRNPGIVPPWLQEEFHILPVHEEFSILPIDTETQFVSEPVSLSPMSLTDALRAR